MDNEISAIDETSTMTNQLEQSTLSGLGARLKKSRESMHLTQKEAAARLYLNPKIIEVIENEAFSDGPPLTFMRGYLRSYARLLSVPESDIKAAVEQLELNTIPVSPLIPTLKASSPIYRGDRYIRWITYLIILTLISFVVLWWSSHSKYMIADVPTTNATPTTVTEVKTPETAAKPAEPAQSLPETTTTSIANPEVDNTPGQMPTAATPAYIAPQATEAPGTSVTTTNPLPTTAPPAVTSPSPIVAPATSAPTDPSVTANPENTPANAMLENDAAPKETPVTPHKKKHKRHQYRPIENMDIPEPD